MVEKQNDLKEVIVHLRTPSGAPAGTRKDLSGESVQALDLYSCYRIAENFSRGPIFALTCNQLSTKVIPACKCTCTCTC